jgi:23S rRNA pseudouridine2605 synthase
LILAFTVFFFFTDVIGKPELVYATIGQYRYFIIIPFAIFLLGVMLWRFFTNPQRIAARQTRLAQQEKQQRAQITRAKRELRRLKTLDELEGFVEQSRGASYFDALTADIEAQRTTIRQADETAEAARQRRLELEEARRNAQRQAEQRAAEALRQSQLRQEALEAEEAARLERRRLQSIQDKARNVLNISESRLRVFRRGGVEISQVLLPRTRDALSCVYDYMATPESHTENVTREISYFWYRFTGYLMPVILDMRPSLRGLDAWTMRGILWFYFTQRGADFLDEEVLQVCEDELARQLQRQGEWASRQLEEVQQEVSPTMERAYAVVPFVEERLGLSPVPDVEGDVVSAAADLIAAGGVETASVATAYRYFVFYKPANVLSNLEAPEGHGLTIYDILRGFIDTTGLYPVGRLDYDTTGCVLLTDNPDLIIAFILPAGHVRKQYRVLARGRVVSGDIATLMAGVDIPLPDGKMYCAKADDGLLLEATDESSSLDLWLSEGKFHQVKLMMGAVRHPVRRLHRECIGPISVAGMREGEVRAIEGEELARLLAAKDESERRIIAQAEEDFNRTLRQYIGLWHDHPEPVRQSASRRIKGLLCQDNEHLHQGIRVIANMYKVAPELADPIDEFLLALATEYPQEVAHNVSLTLRSSNQRFVQEYIKPLLVRILVQIQDIGVEREFERQRNALLVNDDVPAHIRHLNDVVNAYHASSAYQGSGIVVHPQTPEVVAYFLRNPIVPLEVQYLLVNGDDAPLGFIVWCTLAPTDIRMQGFVPMSLSSSMRGRSNELDLLHPGESGSHRGEGPLHTIQVNGAIIDVAEAERGKVHLRFLVWDEEAQGMLAQREGMPLLTYEWIETTRVWLRRFLARYGMRNWFGDIP